MFKITFIVGILALVGCFSTSCRTAPISGGVNVAREELAKLPQPTYDTLRVYVHDLSALGVKTLLSGKPTLKVPLRILSDSALSVLEKESVSMLDMVELSNSIDNIKDGNVKFALNIAWALLEVNGVVRRDDLTATLTEREKGLAIALFKGIRLGTGEDLKVLDAVGPRY
mgnify:CR=1 FL=1